MFRRKKKEEAVEPVAGVEAPVTEEVPAAVASGEDSTSPTISEATAEAEPASVAAEAASPAGDAGASNAGKSARARGNRVQEVGIVSSDKMEKAVGV